MHSRRWLASSVGSFVWPPDLLRREGETLQPTGFHPPLTTMYCAFRTSTAAREPRCLQFLQLRHVAGAGHGMAWRGHSLEFWSLNHAVPPAAGSTIVASSEVPVPYSTVLQVFSPSNV